MADTSLGTSRPRRAQRGQRSAQTPTPGVRVEADTPKPSWLILFFVIALVLPNKFAAGPLDISPYRGILMIMVFPCLAMWAGTKTGPVKGIDFLVIGFAVWSFISIFVLHGFSRWESAGIFTLETVGAYLLGRVFIRSPEQFYFMIKCFCWVIAAMVPFAFIEATTSRIMISEIMGLLSKVHPDLQHEMRFFMHRVQGPFEHPILFGVFCATMTAPALLVWSYGKPWNVRFARLMPIGITTFLSLSVGAYISLIIQMALLFWAYIMRNVQARWMILFSIFVAIYLVLDVFSNRSPIQVFISYLTFNSSASYNRILIWQFGTAEVWRHPLFGIGFNDWDRPPWMVPSIDNFWLLTTMTYGLPSLLLLGSAFVRTIIATGNLDFSKSEMMTSYRLAYLVAVGGLLLSLSTVHVWNASYVFLIFLLGAGVWMRDYVVPEDEAPEGAEDDPEVKGEGPAATVYKSPRRRPPEPARPRAKPEGTRPSRYTRQRR